MKMKKLIVLLAVLAMIGMANAELITNGGFEDAGGYAFIPTGWIMDFNSYGAVWDPHSGLYAIHPGGNGFPGGVFQDITTVPGRLYDVSLWTMNFGFTPGTSNVKVLIGEPGTDTYTFEDGVNYTEKYSSSGLIVRNVPTATDGSWSEATFQFQAIGSTMRFGIYSAPLPGQDGHSTNVDDVSVTAVESAMNPDPQPDNGDGTVGILAGNDVEVTLNWMAGPDPDGVLAVNPDILTHYIYMSVDQNVSSDPNLYYIGQAAQAGQDPDVSFGPITLNNSGIYEWSVEEGLDDGTGNAYGPGDPNNIPGQIWTFNTVVPSVSIVDDPVGDVADPDAAFTVNAAMAESWQWYEVGDPDVALSDDGTYSGTQTATLVVTAPTLDEEGKYYCVVSNSAPSEAISAAAQLWTQRLMGHWKFDGDILDSVAETVSGAAAHDGSIAVNSTIIGLDFGGASDNNFNDITWNGTYPAKDTHGVEIPGVEIEIAGITWGDYNGHDNGGLPAPFNYSNVDNWMGEGDGPITITFSGLDENLTYDFMMHAGWLQRDLAVEATSNDGKTTGVIDTSPAGAPNIGTISGADPNSGPLEFTVVTTTGDITVINAAALIFPTPPAGAPTYASDVADTGVNGDAITFDSGHEYVEIPDSDFFNFYREGFTASAWYKEDAGVGWRMPISKVSNDPLAGWYFMVNSPDDYRAYVIVEPGYVWIGTDPEVATNDGQWHLITATYDPADTTMRLYTDGEYSGQVVIDLSALPLTPAPLSIGGRDGEHTISGGVDDVRIYSYPLSTAEVAGLYIGFKPGESICLADDPAFMNVDLNDDCRINIEDLAMVAARWLECPMVPVEACN